jgi:hypothetical protein
VDDTGSSQIANRGRHKRNAETGGHKADVRLEALGLVQYVGCEAGAMADAEKPIVMARCSAPGEQNHRIALQLRDLHANASRQGVSGRQGDDQRLALDRFQYQAVVVDGQAQDSELNLSAPQRLHLLPGQKRMQFDVRIREAFSPQLQGPRQNVQIGGGHKSDHDLTDLAATRPLRRMHRPLRLFEHASCLHEKGGASGGQRDTTRRSMQKSHTEPALQGLNLLAQGRLRDAQPRSRTTEVKFFGDRNEVAQMA